ncbi:hypothetical protein ACFY7C_36130 [Streptomyces sp. NPDC012769]|uniref:hypothetical protein n=1 Tax=Streptomyces sp. NPDC012769 TaxID=3364848 RepID=UPI00369EB40E
MKSDKVDTRALRSLVPAVSASMISEFLRASGWLLADEREGLAEYWAAPGTRAEEAEDEAVLLPLDEQMRDYDRRLVELLAALADYFDDDASQLEQRITAVGWDTLLFRVNHAGPRQSVPLTEAASLLNVGLEMLRLSALYTDNPHRTGWGGRPSSGVTGYLRDGVRLGHTRQGSFVFPVMSRIGPRHGAQQPFGRRVMVHLAEALGRVHTWAGHGADEAEDLPLFDAAIARSLRPLARAEDLSLELSFRWAPTPLTAPSVPDRPLAFGLSAVRALVGEAQRAPQSARAPRSTQDPQPAERTIRRPVLTTTPARPVQDLTGTVVAIGVDDRNTARGESPYFLVLHVRETDYVMAVSHAEYDYALRARAESRPVTARGKVGLEEGRRTIQGSLVRDQTPSLTRRP